MKNNPTLPIELITEIFLRLPVRSVLRFKCVCKSLRSLISDPHFAISHYNLAASPSHRLLLKSNYFYAQSIDIDTPLNKYDAVFLPLPPRSPPSSPGNFERYDDFHYEVNILGSCRGFILLKYARTDEIIMWNPSIGVHKLLPVLQFFSRITLFLYGFGYDPSTDNYLLIAIQLCEEDPDNSRIMIFSFKTYLWEIEYITVSFMDLDDEFRAGVLLNEALHWFVYSRDKDVPVIIAFDLVKRSLSEIPVLDNLALEKCDVHSLREMGGCLSVSLLVRGFATTEIWVMKEYKVQSSWTKSIVIHTGCIPYFGLQCTFHNVFSPICITKDGGIFGSDDVATLEKLNDEGELLEELKYGGYDQLYCTNLQSALYRESLMSIPPVIGETSEDGQH